MGTQPYSVMIASVWGEATAQLLDALSFFAPARPLRAGA